MLHCKSQTGNRRLSTLTHSTRLGKFGPLTCPPPTYHTISQVRSLIKSLSPLQITLHPAFPFLIPILPQTTHLCSGIEGDTPPQLPTAQVSQSLRPKAHPTVPRPLPLAAPPSGPALPPSPRKLERVSSLSILSLRPLPPPPIH